MRFIIHDPLTGDKESATISFEGNLSDCIPLEHVEEECFHNGIKARTGDLIVDNSSIVTMYAKEPAKGWVAIIVVAIITTIISMAISMVLAKKPKKPRVKSRDRREESPTYAFEGIQDTIAAGHPVPFMLGTGRKGGQVIGTRVELLGDGKQQKLYMLLCLGHGELNASDGVSDVEINGTKSTSFSGVSYDWRAGTSSQSVMTNFEHTIDQTYYDGRDFTDSAITYTTKQDVDSVDLFIGALAGIFHNDDKGDMHFNTSNYTIHYRPQTSAGEPWVLYATTSLHAKSTNQKFKVTSVAFPSKDTYEIKLTWTSASHTEDAFSAWNLSIHNVVERVNGTRTYDGYALLGVSAVSTADLNGRLPNVTCIFKAKVNTPSGLAYTVNNAWCIREILTNSTWGLGHRLTSGLIDPMADSWQDLADYCDTSVDAFSGSESKHEISYVGDAKTNAWDLVNNLLSIIDASLIFSSGKLKVVIDEAQTAAQIYSEANTLEGSFNVSNGRAERRINTVTGQYTNAAEDYVPDFIKVEDTANLATEASKIEDLDLVGVSRQSEAVRVCSRYLKENIYRTKEYSWTSALGAIVSEPGDVVKRQYFVSDFSRGYSGYILSGSLTEVYLDREVTLDSGKTYEIFIKHKAKNTFVNEDIANSAGTWGKVVLADSLTLSAAEGDMWIIGEKDTAIVDVLLNEVTQNDDGTFVLKGSNYNANIYTVDALPSEISRNRSPIGDRPPLAIENWTVRESQDILPDGTIGSFLEFDILPALYRNAGTVTGASYSTVDLSSDEPTRNNFFLNATIQIIDGTGSGQSRRVTGYDGATQRVTINENWSTNPDTTSEYEIDFQQAGEYFGSIVEISDDDADWIELGRIVGTVGALPIRGNGITTYIRLIPYTVSGKRNELALLSRSLTASGTDSVPSDVSTFSVVQINAIVLFTWSNITDLDLDYYEIRKGTSWAQSQFVGQSKQNFFETSEFVAGTQIFLIKAVDRTGNVSDAEAAFSLVLEDPNERALYSITDELDTLSGTFDGLATVDTVRSFDVSAQDAHPQAMAFNNLGTKIFVPASDTSGVVYEYNISSYEVISMSYAQSFSVNTEATVPQAIAFNLDGTKMFILSHSDSEVKEYALSTGFDVSSATYTDGFDVSTQEVSPTGLHFNTDGTKMFVCGYAGDDVNEYSLSTGFDVSSASYTTNYDVSTEDNSPYEVTFNTDGTKMFILGYENNSVYEYTLSIGFDLSSTVAYVDAFVISGQEAAVPLGLQFNDDGTKMYVCGTSSTIYEYQLSTGFDISSASFNNKNAIALGAKYKYDYGYVWDTALSAVSASQVVEVWDSSTVLTGTYITQTFNIGSISYARILADIEFQDSVGIILVIEEQHSDDNITYSPWRIIGAGDQKWQYARLRITMTVTDDTNNPIIIKFDVVIDALVRVYRGIGVTVTTGAGVGVTFSTPYISTPNIMITDRSAAPTVYSDSPSNTGYTLKHDGGGSIVVDWRSEGI